MNNVNQIRNLAYSGRPIRVLRRKVGKIIMKCVFVDRTSFTFLTLTCIRPIGRVLPIMAYPGTRHLRSEGPRRNDHRPADAKEMGMSFNLVRWSQINFTEITSVNIPLQLQLMLMD